MKGRNDEARNVIQKLHAQPDDPEDSFARKEFYQMTQQFALDEQKVRVSRIVLCHIPDCSP